MNKHPETVYEIWARPHGTLYSVALEACYSRAEAESQMARMEARQPQYYYFIREYKNPQVRCRIPVFG